jgi:DNA gyrase subunit A
MALGQGAYVVSASYLDGEMVDSFLSLLVVTERGLGKKVPLSQYPQKGRATAGVVTTELSDGDQVLLTMIVGEEDTLLVIWSGEGGEQVSVVRVTELKAFPRARRGVPLVSGRVLGIVKL